MQRVPLIDGGHEGVQRGEFFLGVDGMYDLCCGFNQVFLFIGGDCRRRTASERKSCQVYRKTICFSATCCCFHILSVWNFRHLTAHARTFQREKLTQHRRFACHATSSGSPVSGGASDPVHIATLAMLGSWIPKRMGRTWCWLTSTTTLAMRGHILLDNVDEADNVEQHFEVFVTRTLVLMGGCRTIF